MRYRLEFESESDGLCDCCGDTTKTVTGLIYDEGGEATAAYFVQWTLGRVESHGAIFDLIVGSWGDGTTGDDRAAIALEFRRVEGAPWFSVIDAEGRPAARSSISRGGLRRDEVIGE